MKLARFFVILFLLQFHLVIDLEFNCNVVNGFHEKESELFWLDAAVQFGELDIAVSQNRQTAHALLLLHRLFVQQLLSLVFDIFVKSMSAFVKPRFKRVSGDFSLLESLLGQFGDRWFVFGGLGVLLGHRQTFSTTHCPTGRLPIKSLICSLYEEVAQSNTLKVNLHTFPAFPREVRLQSLR